MVVVSSNTYEHGAHGLRDRSCAVVCARRASSDPAHVGRTARLASFPRVIVEGEVAEALRARRGVVALESTLIAHGLPAPDNLRVAREAEAAVRAAGAVPATIAVVGGVVRIGLDDDALTAIALGDGRRQGRRARPRARGRARASTRRRRSPRPRTSPPWPGSASSRPAGSAACTAAPASRGTSRPTSRPSRGRRIVVVCAGVKSILDVTATLERLETLNVTVVGYRTDAFPGFYLSDSGHPVTWRVESAGEVAAVMRGAGGPRPRRPRDRGRQPAPARRAARPGAARPRAAREPRGGRGRRGRRAAT